MQRLNGRGTRSEIAEEVPSGDKEMKQHTANVGGLLSHLRDKGYIDLVPEDAGGGWRLTNEARRVLGEGVQAPLLGEVPS